MAFRYHDDFVDLHVVALENGKIGWKGRSPLSVVDFGYVVSGGGGCSGACVGGFGYVVSEFGLMGGGWVFQGGNGACVGGSWG